jgi:hypothetical protein
MPGFRTRADSHTTLQRSTKVHPISRWPGSVSGAKRRLPGATIGKKVDEMKDVGRAVSK